MQEPGRRGGKADGDGHLEALHFVKACFETPCCAWLLSMR
jgi:hypothetical protein